MGASYQPTAADFDTLVSQARAVGTDPLGVLLVLYVESAGFDPGAKDPAGTGGGLNQMDADNLRAAGIPLASWLAMSAAQQLPAVFNFWKGITKTFAAGVFPPDGAHLLALNMLPAYYATTAAVSPTTPIVSKGDAKGYYAANASTYDPQKTGSITVNTIAAGQTKQVTTGNAAQQARWSSLVAGLNAALARAGSPAAPPAPSPPGGAPASPPVILSSLAPQSSGAGVAVGVVAALAALAYAVLRARGGR